MVAFKGSLLILCLAFVFEVGSAESYPPGVPHKQPANNDIKFHEPTEFKNNNQQNNNNNNNDNRNINTQPSQQRHGRHSAHHHEAKLAFNNKDAEKAREHMKQHNKEKFVDVDQLSQPQLIMQHFRNYDLDKNGKIDGLEILKAVAEMNDEHSHDEGGDPEGEDNYTPSEFMDLAQDVDEQLRLYDENDDGFVHYGEFYRNHKKMLDKEAAK